MNKRLIAGLLLFLPSLVAAQNTGGKPVIQVIVDPAQPVAVNHPMAPGPLGANIARMLEERGYQARHLQSGNIALGDTALRVLYVVSEHAVGDDTVVSASAATSLVQRAKLYESTLTLSLYSGVQQSVVQESDPQAARKAAFTAFEKEFGKRLDKALGHLEAVD